MEMEEDTIQCALQWLALSLERWRRRGGRWRERGPWRVWRLGLQPVAPCPPSRECSLICPIMTPRLREVVSHCQLVLSKPAPRQCRGARAECVNMSVSICHGLLAPWGNFPIISLTHRWPFKGLLPANSSQKPRLCRRICSGVRVHTHAQPQARKFPGQHFTYI